MPSSRQSHRHTIIRLNGENRIKQTMAFIFHEFCCRLPVLDVSHFKVAQPFKQTEVIVHRSSLHRFRCSVAPLLDSVSVANTWMNIIFDFNGLLLDHSFISRVPFILAFSKLNGFSSFQSHSDLFRNRKTLYFFRIMTTATLRCGNDALGQLNGRQQNSNSSRGMQHWPEISRIRIQ